MNVLQMLIEELEQDRSLDEPDRLRERIEALDRLETYFPDRQGADETYLCRRARTVQARLEVLNRKLCQTVRREIQTGGGRDSLLRWAPASGRDTGVAGQMSGEGYDYLDELVSGVLPFGMADAEVAELPAEMVFYQPTPARHVFDLIDRVALTERDVLIDLGSGLGHVPLLTAICTSARSIGIELEATYVDCARRSARALNLSRATFLQQDARTADFSSGTVFFLYTPFTGTVLRAVLDALRREAARRAIRICTFGPCTRTIAGEPWLDGVGPVETDRVVIFHSRG